MDSGWTIEGEAAADYCSRMEHFSQVEARSEYEPVVEEALGEQPGWAYHVQVPSFAVIWAI